MRKWDIVYGGFKEGVSILCLSLLLQNTGGFSLLLSRRFHLFIRFLSNEQNLGILQEYATCRVTGHAVNNFRLSAEPLISKDPSEEAWPLQIPASW